ncbi:Vanillate demethylase oxygenase subunit [Granulibacter bethesdensis]|uniref:Vanillate demethylase oxygenase subunit n=2 Tax=Granulibacter bethesdensis TaxID=364410 RepID=Q0BUD6_GRABC|nr:Vanillate demethylase oxygenase subunit [Granulibacter bethesdensis CGDNIH1]AHJ67703.1 Vanillate demethylase oxygenase subunit [Granulibacter bethesdensis]APH51366.1 Vanillate demethylase oxygenase subunit [Granulibacter bethesdensis]APH64059.1 Vanillate demethylase oxygenase subunit [Granulibacter bethesdensis]
MMPGANLCNHAPSSYSVSTAGYRTGMTAVPAPSISSPHSSPLGDPLPRNCTFEAADWQKLARFWYPVALARDVGEQPLSARLLDEELVIYRAGQQIVIAGDLCPHRGVPLSMGHGDGQSIACAYHGFRFGAEGRCIKVPAHPGSAIPGKLHLRTYPATERYGLIWTCLRPDETGSASIPPMPHWDDAGFQQITCPWIDIFGFAGRQMEGFLDVAHFGFVHTGTFGDPENTTVPSYIPVPTRDGFEVEYRSSLSNYPHGSDQPVPEDFVWLRHFRVHLPFTATLSIDFPDHGRLVIMNAASPVSARITRLFVPIARNFDTDRPIQEVYDFNRRVFEEDKAIVEAQKPECLPLDPTLEAHVMADRSSIAYRRALRERGFSHFFTA